MTEAFKPTIETLVYFVFKDYEKHDVPKARHPSR